MRYLGLDLGTRTLGISVSDPLGIIASSREIIRHEEDYQLLIDKVLEIVNELKVEKIILGYPKNMNNTLGEKANITMEFKNMLENKIGIPVVLVDERLSTKEANNLLITADTSRKKRKKVIDSLAATIILQSFLDKRGR